MFFSILVLVFSLVFNNDNNFWPDVRSQHSALVWEFQPERSSAGRPPGAGSQSLLQPATCLALPGRDLDLSEKENKNKSAPVFHLTLRLTINLRLDCFLPPQAPPRSGGCCVHFSHISTSSVWRSRSTLSSLHWTYAWVQEFEHVFLLQQSFYKIHSAENKDPKKQTCLVFAFPKFLMYMSYSFTGGRSKIENVVEKSSSISRSSSSLRFLQPQQKSSSPNCVEYYSLWWIHTLTFAWRQLACWPRAASPPQSRWTSRVESCEFLILSIKQQKNLIELVTSLIQWCTRFNWGERSQTSGRFPPIVVISDSVQHRLSRSDSLILFIHGFLNRLNFFSPLHFRLLHLFILICFLLLPFVSAVLGALIRFFKILLVILQSTKIPSP